jgi:hypothetical protein
VLKGDNLVNLNVSGISNGRYFIKAIPENGMEAVVYPVIKQ